MQCGEIGLEDLGLSGELLVQELGSRQLTLVEPREQSEGEHVLRPLGILLPMSKPSRERTVIEVQWVPGAGRSRAVSRPPADLS